MTRREWIDYCLTLPYAYEDYPFDNITEGGAWAVMRHRGNKKSFAFIFVHDGRLCINLKCDPFEADFLRSTFVGISPAYHMNKTHWNTVVPNSDVPDGELKRQICASYNLIKPKRQEELS